jgi:hypothetical protein
MYHLSQRFNDDVACVLLEGRDLSVLVELYNQIAKRLKPNESVYIWYIGIDKIPVYVYKHTGSKGDKRE